MIKIKAKAISFPKLFLFCLAALFTFSAPTATLADSGWEVAIVELGQAGYFDYTLYYPYSSQVISKVSLPQNQLIKTIDIKYHFTDEKAFIRLEYGGSGIKFKGEGSDSDWTIRGFDTLTDYGVFDVCGEQRVAAVEFGKVFTGNEYQKVSFVIGWVRQETTNELRNVVYHLIDAKDVGAVIQPDNGSRLNGEFSALKLGIVHDLIMRKKLIITTKLNLTFLNADACGHWANHTPAWDWENTGKTIGYGGEIGLKYIINNNIQAKLGYGYNYAKATGCKEILNGDLIAQLVDLEYERKGLYAGLILLF